MVTNRLPCLPGRALIFVITAGILLSAFSPSCSTRGSPAGPEAVTFGATLTGTAVAVYLAQDQNYFKPNGLTVDIKDYSTGVAATEALLRGEVDFALSSEFPMVRSAFEGQKTSIIAVLHRFSSQYLFGRRDRGIERIMDLKGKKIGVVSRSISEFYLGRFLEMNGLRIEDIVLVSVGGQEFYDAISSGRVDAIVAWQPQSSQIKAQMAQEVVAWPVQSNQPGYGVVISRNDWLSSHQQTVTRFLKSVALAEDYLWRNPAAGKKAIQKRVSYDDVFIEVLWSETVFSLSLDQSLITAMEDEARWMIQNNLTTAKQVPSFNDYVYEKALKAIKPGAVNIIR